MFSSVRQVSEPVYMHKHVLQPAERRLLVALWALSSLAWLGGLGLWIFTGRLLPWFVISLAGGILAVVFGMSVRYRYHLFPWWWGSSDGSADRSADAA